MGSSNLQIFGALKKQLAGERLARDAQETSCLLPKLDSDFFYAGTEDFAKVVKSQ